MTHVEEAATQRAVPVRQRSEVQEVLRSVGEAVRCAASPQSRRARRSAREGAARAYEELPPLFHEAWLTSIFDPPVPDLRNNDDERMVLTRVLFAVTDREAVERALDAATSEGVARSMDGAWSWSGPAANGEVVSLATLTLRKERLVVEANSAERGKRARALVERLLGDGVRHRASTHDDLRRQLVERLTAKALGHEVPDEPAPASSPIDPDLAEALVAEHYGRHYRAWIDEPVPALDGLTPREAAKRQKMKPRVEELIRGIEGMYERALKEGQPAYDPSWMRAELGFESGDDAAHPPLLAHERLAQRLPGCANAVKAAAERRRSEAAFDETVTTVVADEVASDLDLQRFLRGESPSANDSDQEPAQALPYLPVMLNFELHHRKIFWVDPALSYMLESTDVDLPGNELRTPFPAFALAFTDRHALSLGERLLARETDDPHSGHLLRVITVYVTEEHGIEGRFLSVTFAFDALGADLPSLEHREVPTGSEASVRAFLESVGPSPTASPDLPDRHPLRALLRLVINAILYATSAGVTPEVRKAPAPRSVSRAGSVYPDRVHACPLVSTQSARSVSTPVHSVPVCRPNSGNPRESRRFLR